MFIQTNDGTRNEVLRYGRMSNGMLGAPKRYATGGTGAPSQATGFPFVDTQGAVTLTPDEDVLLVTNSGSNELTSFRVLRNGLKRVSTIGSGGRNPISVTANDNGVVYVLNEGGTPNVSGFRLTSRGKLRRISRSRRALRYPRGAPAQVGFDARGRVLVVSDRMSGPMNAPDVVETMRVRSNGRTTGHAVRAMRGQTPFGFAFTSDNTMVMTDADNDEAGQSTVSTYRVSRSGAMSFRDLQPTGQTAACWIDITRNDRWAFTSNALSASISAFRISDAGRLTNRAPGQPSGTTGGVALDLSLSKNDKFLYVVNVDPGFINPDPAQAATARAHIDVFGVAGNGALTKLGTFGTDLPASTSGIAAL